MFYLLLMALGAGLQVFYAELPKLWYWLAPLVCVVYAGLHLAAARTASWAHLPFFISSFNATFPVNTVCLLKRSSGLAAAFCIGAACGSYSLQQLVTAQLPHAWDKQTVELRFEVVQAQAATDTRSVSLAVKVLAATVPVLNKTVPVLNTTVPNATQTTSDYSLVGKTLRLAWYQPDVVLAAGQQWQAQVVVRRPRGFVNPEGFDYAAWVLGQGYNATGYIKAQTTPILLANQPDLRDRLRSHLHEGLSAAGSSQPFFEALLLGQREGISPAQWQILQATGTVHLMAISGLHVGLVAALGFALGLAMVKLFLRGPFIGRRGLWRASGANALRPSTKPSQPSTKPSQPSTKPSQQAGKSGSAIARGGHNYRWLPALLAVASAASYALLAGMAVPTQRALLAVVLLNVAWLFGLKSARWQVFAWVLLLVVIGEPMAALQSGFWLSFAAVAILMALMGGLRRSSITRKYLRTRKALSLQCVLAVAMALPLWLLGLPASVLSPLANLVAVPVVALLMVPALLVWVPLSFTPLSALFIQALAYLFNALWWLLDLLAQWPYAAAWGSGNGYVLVLVALALVMLLLPRTLAMRTAGCGLIALVLVGAKPTPQAFKIVVLDVGQGLAVVVHDHQQTLLYDTGPAFSPRFNAGANIIAPYLRMQGLAVVAPAGGLIPFMPTPARNNGLSVMVSHADNDHRGGFNAVNTAFAPADIWVGEPFEGLPPRATNCQRGQHWQWQNAHYHVLWPPAQLPDAPPRWSGNNSSCVLLVESQGVRFLLAGDIEAEAEQQLVAEGNLPEVDVLIAPHHGSKTSSTLAFLAALKPKHIVVSAGFKSAYGHPHPSVVARYASVNAQVWNTASNGAVMMQLQDGALRVAGLRQWQPKFWH
ncbi:MAG: DNA internalization-related competence protein ComEC/Rec2 [Marinagarivorans sp.]|nr:DNA internalization-related competence protein ComEC/Rec2 [Marinagarivorans sp.]